MASSSGGNYYSILDPDPPNKRKKTNGNFNLNNSYDFPKLSEKSVNRKECPKYIVLKSKTADKPIQSYNIFLVSKALEAISSDQPQKITFTKDRNLLILTKNESQTLRFLKATTLPGLCSIESSLHPTLNIVKGVVFAPALRDLSEKEIIDGLKQQGIVDCKKITKFVDGKVINTPLHIMHFNEYSLPKEIKIGFLICKVEPYIPSPIQCKNCFKFGHTRKFCKNDSICEVCSTTIHDPIPCKKIQCVNCSHSHRANNKKCPVFLHRQSILKYKITNKCTYKEAATKIPTIDQIDIPTEDLNTAIETRKIRKTLQNNNTNNDNQTTPKSTTINSPLTTIYSTKEPNGNTHSITNKNNITTNQLHINNPIKEPKSIISAVMFSSFDGLLSRL